MDKIEELYRFTCIDRPFLTVLALCCAAIGVGLATPAIADVVVGVGHYPRFLFTDELAGTTKAIRDTASMMAAIAFVPWLHLTSPPWDVISRRTEEAALAIIVATVCGLQLF